jgi:hypothetical protein
MQGPYCKASYKGASSVHNRPTVDAHDILTREATVCKYEALFKAPAYRGYLSKGYKGICELSHKTPWFA